MYYQNHEVILCPELKSQTNHTQVILAFAYNVISDKPGYPDYQVERTYANRKSAEEHLQRNNRYTGKQVTYNHDRIERVKVRL